ncbi:hypothetical protein BDN70DRAFT_184041 [Pholiota conissans]|uniref:Uncharacterized protein n=1 Tax=Pholiota conissans TaxID=109636 RepID=A0A9P5YWA6_9AGAR|nr:hypothetical protein BDN70DRAFT_184041 [Pholiota conissans]
MSTSKSQDNPYLSHLPPHQRGVGQANPSAKEPLYGFVPRLVKGDQVRTAMDGDVNPFTKQPHSGQYKKILDARKKLPVFAQMDEFLKIVSTTSLCLEEGIEILSLAPSSRSQNVN